MENGNGALQVVQGRDVAIKPMEWTRDQVDLIKRTVAKGTTDDELKLFMYTAKKTGLDPLMKQIHAIKRNSKDGAVMSIQTGIDGYRLLADRTGLYAPGREPSFVEKDGKVVSATAYVKKLVGGAWHEIAASAHFDEYVQRKYDGTPNVFWSTKPRIMLAKCAEALALRRAFPAELSGIYTHDEMGTEAPEITEKAVVPITADTPPESNPTPTSADPEDQPGIIKNGKFQPLPAEPEIESATITVATIDSHNYGADKYLYRITDEEGVSYTTFSSTIYAKCEEARISIKPLAIKFKRQPGKVGTKYEGQIFLHLVEAEYAALDTIQNH